MAIIRVSKDDIESFTVATNPFRSYSSSSSGVTGSLHVFPRRSHLEKDMRVSNSYIDGKHSDHDINQTLRSARNSINSGKPSYSAFMKYMEEVNSQSVQVNKQKVLEIYRFTPSYTFTSNTLRKLIVKDLLMPNSRLYNPSANWAYTNYHSLNFFTSSNVNPGAALLYPNVKNTYGSESDGHMSGAYVLNGPFSFDFYINPRYNTLGAGEEFKAGTILHLSSCYAVSLVTGSAKNKNGLPVGFRLQLQLSHSADIAPSLATQGTYPNDLVFMSDDNSLSWNNWHHVVIRWGGKNVNQGTGSFNIDGVDRGTFNVFSSTIAPLTFPVGTKYEPDVLCVGNFYEGDNTVTNPLSYFFAADPATRDGLQVMNIAGSVNEPASYVFDHPLNAEIHNLAIKRYYVSNAEIAASSSTGPSTVNSSSVAFYLPPFFTEGSPYKQSVNGVGGVLQTPFFEADGTTDDPFNVAMSFGVAGHYINTDNFLKDFSNNVFPRLHQLTGTAITYTTEARTANEFLYDDPFVRRRNLFILPCDDGNFYPNFHLVSAAGSQRSAYDDEGRPSPDLINLSFLLSTSSLTYGTTFEAEGTTATSASDFSESLIGFTPEKPGVKPGPAYFSYLKNLSGTYGAGVQVGAPLTIYQRTLDGSSNQVTFFDISNLFYGKRIHPGTLVLKDTSMSGSGGAFGITLKDDGMGNIYRADCLTTPSKVNNVGNIFYDEGIIVIKSPHLFFFGHDQFEMTFRGEQNVHSMKIEVIAPQAKLNHSNNPSFVPVSASTLSNDNDKEFVYISGINFHDKDFNVVARSSLAQPIVKRHGSRILFKVTYDF